MSADSSRFGCSVSVWAVLGLACALCAAFPASAATALPGVAAKRMAHKHKAAHLKTLPSVDPVQQAPPHGPVSPYARAAAARDAAGLPPPGHARFTPSAAPAPPAAPGP